MQNYQPNRPSGVLDKNGERHLYGLKLTNSKFKVLCVSNSKVNIQILFMAPCDTHKYQTG